MLVLPVSFLARLPGPVPGVARPNKVAHAEHRHKWLDLADSILKQYPVVSANLQRSVLYLTRVGRGAAPLPSFEPLPWHETVKQADLAQGMDTLSSCSMLLPVATFKAQLRR